MTAVVPISILGTLVFVLGIRLLVQSRNKRHTPVTADQYTRAREALDSILTETETIRRIFSVEDLEFIARTATPDAQSLFLNERRRLALQLVRMTRKQVGHLMDLHLRLTSNTYDPSLRFELALTTKFVIFNVVSIVALVLVWLFGPFRATRVVSYTVRQAGNFFIAFDLRLRRVNPLRLRSRHESLIH